MEMEYMSSKELLKRADILYQFVDLFESYENVARNYCNPEDPVLLTMNEIHLLAMIEANPGIMRRNLWIRREKVRALSHRCSLSWRSTGM